MERCVQESVAVVCNVDDLVDGALQGFAVTVFAFGQTGSVRLSGRRPIIKGGQQDSLAESDVHLHTATCIVTSKYQQA